MENQPLATALLNVGAVGIICFILLKFLLTTYDKILNQHAKTLNQIKNQLDQLIERQNKFLTRVNHNIKRIAEILKIFAEYELQIKERDTKSLKSQKPNDQ